MPNSDGAAKALKLSLKVGGPGFPSRWFSKASAWSQWPGLNRRPTVYETVALPLSYIGVLAEVAMYPIRQKTEGNFACLSDANRLV